MILKYYTLKIYQILASSYDLVRIEVLPYTSNVSISLLSVKT